MSAAASWDAVDALFDERLIGRDAVLEAALAASDAAGLRAISVSPPQGRLLELLARIHGARHVLEIGTLGGYSAICLARALPADGSLLTLEREPSCAEVARANLARAGLAVRTEVRVGLALESLDALAGEGRAPFDFTFIDADKANNTAYFERATRLSRPGAVIVVDNVVRGGRVADADSRDASVLGVRALLDHLARRGDVRCTAIQTVGSKGYDGFLLARLAGPAA